MDSGRQASGALTVSAFLSRAAQKDFFAQTSRTASGAVGGGFDGFHDNGQGVFEHELDGNEVG